MKFQVTKVTPEMARKWIAMNGQNRPLRSFTVDMLERAIRRGEWKTSHQSIAITPQGNILDGQHRCHAIVKSGIAVDCVVCFDADPETFDVVDIGVKRTITDITGVHQGIVGVMSFINALGNSSQKSAKLSPQQFNDYYAIFGRATEDLISFCPLISKGFSTAPVRTAAVLRMLGGGDEDYIKLTYYQLNHKELRSLSPIAATFFRQYLDKDRRISLLDMFARAWKTFDKASARSERLLIKDIRPYLSEAREVIDSIIKQKSRTNAGKKLMKDIQYDRSSVQGA